MHTQSNAICTCVCGGREVGMCETDMPPPACVEETVCNYFFLKYELFPFANKELTRFVRHPD